MAAPSPARPRSPRSPTRPPRSSSAPVAPPTTPQVTARLVTLVDDLGLSPVADLWSARPARSLPGALWPLYALREWVRRSPEPASR